MRYQLRLLSAASDNSAVRHKNQLMQAVQLPDTVTQMLELRSLLGVTVYTLPGKLPNKILTCLKL